MKNTIKLGILAFALLGANLMTKAFAYEILDDQTFVTNGATGEVKEVSPEDLKKNSKDQETLDSLSKITQYP